MPFKGSENFAPQFFRRKMHQKFWFLGSLSGVVNLQLPGRSGTCEHLFAGQKSAQLCTAGTAKVQATLGRAWMALKAVVRQHRTPVPKGGRGALFWHRLRESCLGGKLLIFSADKFPACARE